MRRVALFDVAGTLVAGNPWRGFLKYDGMNKLRVYGSYPLITPPYWAKNWGLISDTRFRQIWVRQMAGLLRGMSREETNGLFRWIAAEFMRYNYREDVLARLGQHKQNGDYVLLVSGMFTPLTQAFADVVGADAGVGTGLGFDADGVCNGQIVGAVCAGALKPQIARDFLGEQGIVLDGAETFGYADSYSDVPLLAASDHATATYPDEKLKAEIVARGWACIG
jgi:phosphoserine phosphatase